MSWSARVSVTRPSLTLLAVVGLTALGCGADVPGQPFQAPAPVAPAAITPGSPVRGELMSYIFTFEDGRTDEQFFLRLPSGEERRLHFDTPPDIAGGTSLEIMPKALMADGEIRVGSVKLLENRSPIETRQSALKAGQAYRPRKMAFVLVDLGQGVNVTKEMAQQRMFGTNTNDGSLRQYYVEASYGRQDLGGDIIGPLRATMSGCNFSSLPQQLRSQIPGQYDHYLWYFGRSVAGCGFLGVAVSGTPDRPTRDSWYNASTGCVVLVQEPGHNFGMMHASSMRCGSGATGRTFVDQPMGACTHSEYGDPYDPMGRACRHMNAYMKAFQGWFGGCNMVEVTSSGTFTVNPLELPCDGVQVLQIPMPKMRPFTRSGGGGPSGITTLTHYYVEFRASHGFDRMIPPTVQVRVSGDVRMRTQRGFHTWVLDMNPATTTVDGLAAGGSYTDPAGNIKITVESMDAQKASVKVEITGGAGGAPMCQDGTPFTGPGPGPESCSAGPAVPSGAPPSISDGGLPPIGGGSDASNNAPRDGGGMETLGGDTARGTGGAGGTGGGGIDDPRPTGGSGGTGTGGAGGSSSTGGSGTAGRGGSGQAGSGMNASGGSTAPPPVVSGCGCRVGDAGQPGGTPVVLAFALAALVIVRRRRTRS
jgi:MYXO-CTERM domain-containing protein